MNIWRKINTVHPDGLLLSAGIILQLDKSTRELSLGFIILWIGICLIRGIFINRKSSENLSLSTAYAIALGILLFQARSVMKGVDENGITQFLLIAAGIAASSSLSKRQWEFLLMWLSIASLGISSLLLMHYSPEAGWMVKIYSDVFRDGLGGNINKLGLALVYLTISSWSCYRISNMIIVKLIGMSGLILGFVCCIYSGSRMAILAPLMGAFLGWILAHIEWIKKLKIKERLVLVCGFIFTTLTALLTIVVKPQIDSDAGFWSDLVRVNLFKCWIGTLFTGHNRLIYGTGHTTEFIRTYCTSDKIFLFGDSSPSRTFDYAHNTFAQVIGLYGLLGLTALVVLTVVYVRGLRLNFVKERDSLKSSLRRSSWTEVTLATMVSTLICALAESSYHGDPVLQVLSGIIIAFPLNQVSSLEQFSRK